MKEQVKEIINNDQSAEEQFEALQDLGLDLEEMFEMILELGE